MKIVFFGNADFGLHALKSLVQSPDHEIIAIVTNPETYLIKVAWKPFNPASANFGNANMMANKNEAANMYRMPLARLFKIGRI